MTPKTDDLVKLLPCPFCGGEAEFMLDGTQPDVTCKECDISYSVQVSDHFTQEERYNNPDFQWRDGPEYNYGPGGQKRAKDLLTEYWNTRTQPPQDGGSALPEKWPTTGPDFNSWQEDAAGFVRIVQDNPNFWWFDHEIKYLNLRIDTRDGAFLLFAEEKIDPNVVKKRISPDKVLQAIREYREKMSDAQPAKTNGDKL